MPTKDRQARYRERRKNDPAWVEKQRLYRKAWYDRTKEARNTYAREYARARGGYAEQRARDRKEKWPAIALNMAKARAKKSGLEFNIDRSDVFLPLVCPVLGTPICPGSKDRRQWPSLDRIDNSLGYIKGNVCVISWRANRLKGDATANELAQLVRYMRQEDSMTNITSVTVCFGNGQKREEYGPVKKAEASITACVAENEDGEAVLDSIKAIAMRKVAEMLDAPKPDTVSSASIQKANEQQAAPEPAGEEGPPPRGRGRPRKEKPVEEPQPEPTPEPAAGVENSTPEDQNSANDEWASVPDDIVIDDAQILAATSKRAGELGAREPIVKLIATFATRTEGAPFKVQEIPQAQRKDYLAKLAALTA